MADETISTRIVANADFSALIADVHRVTASLSKLQQELASSNKMLANQIAVMNRSFSDTLRSTGQYSTHFVSLQSDVEKFGKNLDGGKLKLNQYFNTFRDQARTSGGLIRDLAKQQVALQNAVLQPLGRNAQGLMQFNVHVPRGLDEVKNKTAIARQELQIMNKVIQDGAGQLINWGKNTQWAGRQLTVGLTVPLVAFGAQAAKAFREADQELVRLTKVYGDVAGTSAAELGKVRDDVAKTAKEISSAMGVSFKETIGLAADIAATGKTGDELLGSIKETTRLAVLGEVDRQEAMKATLAIQSAFKQNTDELSESINFLNAVENQTSTTLNDLVEAIPKAGPVIKGLGGSVQDLALYLTAMREGGINASEGANALKSALASLINPTDVAVGKFQTLGIDLLGIVNNNAGDLTGTLMTLQAALDNLDPLQKQQAIEQLFGKFQFARLNALFENLGRQGSQTLQVLDLMKASSEDLAAVAGRELSAVTESASGKYRRAIESLRASLAEVGEQFLTINTVLIQVIDKVVQFANNLPGPVKQVLALAGGFTAVIGPVIMLTGVLANFFGYILKGVFHLKSFFKGNEGWKYLTPEMLAAEKAGKLVEQSFYSDAKAAAVLKQALGNLIDEFSILEAKAKSGAMSVNPAVSTMAGNLVMAAGGSRVVDPNNPLAGTMGTRASSHMVPRSGMTEAQRLQQTMFGMVPGSIPVNQRIGQNPQIYMDDALPNVPGLTTVKGVSTGIVSGEAARWHSMMATLGMQSKAEIENLKKTIAATGTVSKEFMMQFDDILPAVSVLTKNAAVESSLIVAELRAGKINLDAARAKIVALNLETERLIAATVQAQATAMGRTINPTMVPTLNQPVVDPTGKSNMRELFKKGKTRDFINKIAGTLGVRTSGAGYNIETTKPRRMASGGMVYRKKGSEGPEFAPMGTDTVPAMLTPGEFVVKASSVTPETLPILKQMNEGYIRGPETETVQVPRTRMSGSEVKSIDPSFRGSKPSYEIKGTSGLYVGNITDPAIVDKYPRLAKDGMITREMINKALEADVPGKQLPAEVMLAGIAARTSPYRSTTEQFLYELAEQGQITKADARMASNDIHNFYERTIKSKAILSDKSNPFYGASNAVLKAKFGHNANLMNLWEQFSSSIGGHTAVAAPGARRSGTTARVLSLNALDGSKVKISKLQGNSSTTMVHGSTPGPLLNRIGAAGITRSISRALPFVFSRGRIRMANGGMVPNVQYMEDGSDGPVKPSFSSGFQAARNKPSGGGGMSAMGSTGMFMGGMGLSMAGSAVGGTAGTVMNSAGMAMQFLPMLSGLKSVMGGLTKVTALAKTFGSIAGTIFRVAGTAVKFFTGPVGLAVLGITALVQVFKFWRKGIEDTRKEQTALYGMSEKGAKELGISYTSVTDKMKALKEEQKLAADKAKAYFESYSMAGGGLTLTIKQLKELKERVKTDMPDTLAILNNIDSSKVNDWAANLKAQMISSGKSVEESTNLIYALIEASDKAGQGVGAISSKLFAGITDQSQAADYILKNLATNIKNINDIDPSAFASNLDTAISSLDNIVKSLVGTKDASGNIIDEQKAIAMQYEQIVASGVKNNQIGKDTLKVLQSQRPEFANILNSSDTIGGMIAKWRVHTENVYLDLKKITSEQAELLAGFYDAMDAAADAALTLGGGVDGLNDAAKVLDTLSTKEKAQRSFSENGAKSVEKYSKTKIKALQDELKEVKKLADAKRKALNDSFNKENAELELQKAKLELQSAVARGDNEAIAMSQIKIQQIQKEQSVEAAIAKINENEKKKEESINAKIDAENAKRDKKMEGVSGAGATADKIGASASLVRTIGEEITKASALKKAFEATPTKENKEAYELAANNVLRKIAENASKDKNVLDAYGKFLQKDDKGNFKKDKKGMFVPQTIDKQALFMKDGVLPGTGADTLFSDIGSNLQKFALDLMGKDKKTLSDIYGIMAKAFPGAAKPTPMSSPGPAVPGARGGRPGQTDSTYSGSWGSYGDAVSNKPGRLYTPPGQARYIMDESGVKVFENMDPKRFKEIAKKYGTKLSMGGPVRNYVDGSMGGVWGPGTSTSDSIPAMLSNGEYVLNAAATQKFGIPLLDRMNGSYNIPSGSISGVNSTSNASSNNIVYNIDIDLNGTNVTADDIMRKFKSELALIGAKEGRVRNLGGNY